jgi:hypothetical protein
VVMSESELDEIVDDILAHLPLKERVLIARVDEESLPSMAYAFDRLIEERVGKDEKAGLSVMRRLWERVRETDGLRVVER